MGSFHRPEAIVSWTGFWSVVYMSGPEGEMFGVHHGSPARNHGPSQGVLELSDVTGPVVGSELSDSGLGDPTNIGVDLVRELRHEVFCQQGDVSSSVPERGNPDLHNLKSKEEILPEPPLPDLRLQGALSCG